MLVITLLELQNGSYPIVQVQEEIAIFLVEKDEQEFVYFVA